MASEQDLLRLILDQNPYEKPADWGEAYAGVSADPGVAPSNYTPPSTAAALAAGPQGFTFDLAGIAAGNFQRQGYRLTCGDIVKLHNDLVAAPFTGLYWGFGIDQYPITKALRIPYSFDCAGNERHDYLLVGYAGVGW